MIDAGFNNADCIKALQGVDIKGTRNFVHPGHTVYDGQMHGMNVLSCIATNRPGALVGTAPEASFYLLVSEDDSTEHKVEEDYWCAAVEYADSVGCDVVTSSLGYAGFDDPAEVLATTSWMAARTSTAGWPHWQPRAAWCCSTAPETAEKSRW